MIDSEVDCIFIVGTYEPRHFSDYCIRKSVEAGRSVKYLKTASLVPEKIISTVSDKIFSSGISHVIVMPANIFFNFNMDRLMSTHNRTGSICTLVCKQMDEQDREEQMYVKIDPDTKSKY